MIRKQDFGEAVLYTIEGRELCVSVSSRGATVTSLRFRGREMVLGYDSDREYLAGLSLIHI